MLENKKSISDQRTVKYKILKRYQGVPLMAFRTSLLFIIFGMR